MAQNAGTYQHELPEREVFAIYPGFVLRHTREHLKRTADDFHIKNKRRLFYDKAFWLAHDYSMDRIVEEDFSSVTAGRRAFERAAASGQRFLDDLEALFSNRSYYSLWNESYFMCQGNLERIALEFRRDDLAIQTGYFVRLTREFAEQLPSPPPSRKKRLALRKWAKGHLNFWAQELGKPITVINDRRDGYSECHRFLRQLLEEIDPKSLPRLDTIVREYRAEHRAKTALR